MSRFPFNTKSLRLLPSNLISFSTPYHRAMFTPPSFHRKTISYVTEPCDSGRVPVAVWWDFNSCPLPNGVDVCTVRPAIAQALKSSGIDGRLREIRAVGDMTKPWNPNPDCLSVEGMTFNHVPEDERCSANQNVYLNVSYWINRNPPPAHLFLVGNRTYGGALWRSQQYNVLLAGSYATPSIYRSFGTIMWDWNQLLKGESLHGKHYCPPPPLKVYGEYKLPLDDPCTDIIEQLLGFVLADGSLYEADGDTDIAYEGHLVPQNIIDEICRILSLYPKGMDVTKFELELGKMNVGTEKELFGYESLACLLLSMQHVLRIQFEGDALSCSVYDCKFWVHGVRQNLAV